MGCGSSLQPEQGRELPHNPSFYTYESTLSTDLPDLRDSIGNLPTARIQYGLWFPPCYGPTNPNTNTEYHHCSATTDGPKVPLLLYLHGAGGRDLREPGKMNVAFTMERLWNEYPNPLNLVNDPNYPFAVMVPHCPLGGLSRTGSILSCSCRGGMGEEADGIPCDSSRASRGRGA